MDSFISEKRSFSRSDVAMLLVSQNALAQLEVADAAVIVTYMNAKRVNAKETVIQEGFANTGFLALILQGHAVVENEYAKKGDSLVISLVEAGALIGELGLIDGQPRSATVRAVTELDLAVLERTALAKLMEEKPAITCRLLASMLASISNKLRSTNKKLRSMHAINRSLQDQIQCSTSGLAPLLGTTH